MRQREGLPGDVVGLAQALDGRGTPAGEHRHGAAPDSRYDGPRTRNAWDASSPGNTEGKESALLATLNL
ncbi:hypothetical protein GCM10010420_14770 [Streptomyces glaucosporus]|uniref:Uncharacterized protein n=1 Tax=Streptomyces glaucosporus TaxID=284044 RepID=A0ABN3HZQ1_9ACTN